MSNLAVAPQGWSFGTRTAFRFACLLTIGFSASFLMPMQLGWVPLGEPLAARWDAAVQKLWMPVVGWVGREILHVAPTPLVNQMISLLCVAILAGLGAAVWGYADRRRQEYRTLHAWLSVYLRFALGIPLIGYGLLKVLLNQFDFPTSPTNLMTPVGELTPFWMLVSFSGSSSLYQSFAGAVELLAGVLVMIRPTATVGALLAAVAMANVVVLNFAFFPGGMVRVHATSMLIMSMILVVPVLPRLLAVLLSDRALAAPVRSTLFANPRANRLAAALGLAAVLAVVGYDVKWNLREGVHWRSRPPLYGAYEVESYARTGQVIAPAGEEDAQWKWFAVDPKPSGNRMPGDAFATVAFAEHADRFVLQADTIQKTLRLQSFGDPKAGSRWAYSTPDSGHLVMMSVGPTHLDTLRITLRRRDFRTFALFRSNSSLR